MSVPISSTNFAEDNYALFAEIAYEEGRPVAEVAKEHYDSYIESIEDRDNDY